MIELLALAATLWKPVDLDGLFQYYGERNDLAPAMLKAQARAESNFDPHAKSRVGAMGIMQLMPSTYDEQSKRLGVNCSPWSPKCSIMLGADYDRRMIGQFKRDSHRESARWGLASYNAGLGTVLRHQIDCDGTRVFMDVRPCLYEETRSYVHKIEVWWDEYET